MVTSQCNKLFCFHDLTYYQGKTCLQEVDYQQGFLSWIIDLCTLCLWATQTLCLPSCTFSTSADVSKPTQAPKQDARAVILVLPSLTPGSQSTSSPTDLAFFVFLGWICFLHFSCYFYIYTPRPLGSSASELTSQIGFKICFSIFHLLAIGLYKMDVPCFNPLSRPSLRVISNSVSLSYKAVHGASSAHPSSYSQSALYSSALKNNL